MPDKKLTAEQKAVKVLRSQGHAPILLTNCTPEAAAELTAMYGAADLPQQFAAWLDRHLKATIGGEDDEPTELEEPQIVKAVSTDDDGS